MITVPKFISLTSLDLPLHGLGSLLLRKLREYTLQQCKFTQTTLPNRSKFSYKKRN